MSTFTLESSVLAKVKKHTILFDEEVDFELIGICSPHNDYRVAWNLNNKLHIDLAKASNLYEVYSKKGLLASKHTFYKYIDEQDGVEWYLIKNKHEGKFLIPEKNQIDHFLFIRNNILLDLDEVLEKIKTLSSIVAAFSFEPDAIPSTQLIQFE